MMFRIRVLYYWEHLWSFIAYITCERTEANTVGGIRYITHTGPNWKAGFLHDNEVWTNQTMRFQQALDEKCPTPPVSAPPLFLV